ncbi:hypothetical protein ABDB91_12165 [Desulfoscipio sp. XC116]|uniref:hypothetical protein n=1 Tax=Desulfoscipio sp. XC116 TaxID=3144975 RepID=UPI00325A7220
MKNKKTIAVILCVSFLLSGAGFISTGFAGDPMQIKDWFVNQQHMEQTIGKSTDKKDLSNAQSDAQFLESAFDNRPTNNSLAHSANLNIDPPEAIIVENNDNEGMIYQGERVSLEEGDAFKNDKYHIGKDEMEELIKEGHSIADIFKLDELANRLDEDPQKLLALKKGKNQSWEQVEKSLLMERAEKYLAKLKEKHPEEYEQLQARGLSLEEQFTLMAMYDKHIAPTMQELIKTYEQDGEGGLTNIIKNQKPVTNVSKEKIDKYGLTQQDTEEISDEIIQKMEMLSQKTDIPVKELIKGYQEERHR